MKAVGFDDKLSNSGASCCRCHFFVQYCIGFDENEKKPLKSLSGFFLRTIPLFYCPALPPSPSARTN
jgi:hypothetical protein